MADPALGGERVSNEEEKMAALENGRRLFAGPCDFVKGVVDLEYLPPASLTEIAFSGRSNVGKSSLINALTNRKGLARASNTPGRTQEINFFNLGNRLMLVDLPGHGFAKAPKTQVERWTHLVNAYLKGRVVLRRTCLLIDARHGLKENDRDVMKMLDKAAQNYQIVLTKIDKIGPNALLHIHQAVAEEIKTHPAAHPDIINTSSETGAGLPELRAALAALASAP